MSKELHDNDEVLDEGDFKSSFGVDAEVPASTTKQTTEKPKNKGEPMPKLNTKAGMINAMVQHMSSMKKEELKAAYGKMFEENYDEDGEEQEVNNEEVRAISKITANDIDISEDIDAIFNGTELDESYKNTVATIFEAAVVAKVNEQLEKLAVETESTFEAESITAINELSEKVDSYLDYVIQEWVEENKLAIEQGVRAEMVEDFLKGLHTLFTEHYVDIPEEKIDVVEELVAKIDELEEKLDKQLNENVSLTEKVRTFEKEVLFSEMTEDLTDVQIDKLKSLVEGIEYIDEKDFTKKVSLLKAQYFDIDEEVTTSLINDDEKDPISLEEETKVPTGAMAAYTSAISRSVKK